MSTSFETAATDVAISFNDEPESSFAAWSIDDLDESSDLESLRSASAWADPSDA
jgi:hypothetical protein